MTGRSAATLFFSLLLAAFMATGHAATCSVPYLAPGLCDRNGDLVADTPDDRTKWLDPNPLILADIPHTDMTSRAEQSEPFIRYLEAALGRKVNYFVAKDNADLRAAFRAQRVHIVNFNAGSVVRMVSCDGLVPVAQGIDETGNVAGYRMELVVPASSTIKRTRELKGRRIAFVDEFSNSGYLMARALLEKSFRLTAGNDYSFEFSGRQDNSVMGVANGLYEAAAVASDVREGLVKEGLIGPNALRVIYSSPSFPKSVWGVSHRLSPAMTDRIRAAFVHYNGPVGALYGTSRFRAANYKGDWELTRDLSPTGSQPGNCN